MTAPSAGFSSLLTTHVGTSGWAIEVGAMPSSPDRVIMISDSGGRPANPKWLLDFPNVQTMIRGKIGDYTATFAEAVAVKDILLGVDSQDLLGDRWVAINLMSDLAFVGRDSNERPLFSINWALIIEPALSGDSNRSAL